MDELGFRLRGGALRTSSVGRLEVTILESLTQPLLELRRESIVASLARWLHVELVELRLVVHLLITEGAGEAWNAPALPEGLEGLSSTRLATLEAQIAVQHVIVSLTVGESFLLVVTVAEEGLLTHGTHKVLYMPVLPESSDDSLFNGTMTGSADWNTHLIVASEAVESSSDFSTLRCQLFVASLAREVIRME